MYYRLEYEFERTWSSFHETASSKPLERQFERKFVWYLADTPIPVSPYFSKLSDARHWFEMKMRINRNDPERRASTRVRRSDTNFSTLSFSKKYDRRADSGRRWIDQIGKFGY